LVFVVVIRNMVFQWLLLILWGFSATYGTTM